MAQVFLWTVYRLSLDYYILFIRNCYLKCLPLCENLRTVKNEKKLPWSLYINWILIIQGHYSLTLHSLHTIRQKLLTRYLSWSKLTLHRLPLHHIHTRGRLWPSLRKVIFKAVRCPGMSTWRFRFLGFYFCKYWSELESYFYTTQSLSVA